jgi:hypothetical protein
MSFRELRALFCFLITYAMPFEDLFHYSRLATKTTRYNDLFVNVFWVKTNILEEKLFFGIGIRFAPRLSW